MSSKVDTFKDISVLHIIINKDFEQRSKIKYYQFGNYFVDEGGFSQALPRKDSNNFYWKSRKNGRRFYYGENVIRNLLCFEDTSIDLIAPFTFDDMCDFSNMIC